MNSNRCMDRHILPIQVHVASLDRPVSSLCMTLQAQKILTHLSSTRVSLPRQTHSGKASLAGETTLEQVYTFLPLHNSLANQGSISALRKQLPRPREKGLATRTIRISPPLRVLSHIETIVGTLCVQKTTQSYMSDVLRWGRVVPRPMPYQTSTRIRTPW